MNEEEKKAIEFIKRELEDEKKQRNDYQSLTGLYGNLEIETLLNLIEKQQKEIEDLKGNNIAISKASYMAGVCNERDEWHKKINEKIEDLGQEKKADGLDYDWLRDTMISALKELIGKDN